MPDRVIIESCEERRELLHLKPTEKFTWENFFTAPTPEIENDHNAQFENFTRNYGIGYGILVILHAILENYVS